MNEMRKSLILFFVLSYGVSWLFWSPLVVFSELHRVVMFLFLTLGGLGPLFSGLIVSVIYHKKCGVKDYFKRMFLVKVPWKMLVLSLVLPIGIFVLAFGLYRVMNGTPATVSDAPGFYFYPVLLLYVILLGGGLEEPGWRGFALPRMQSVMSPLLASFVLGLIWVFWHLPLFFSDHVTQTSFNFTWYLINGLGLSVLFTIFFNYTRQSAFVAILLHGGVNAPSAWFPLEGEVSTIFGKMPAHFPVALATWLVVIILMLLLRPYLLYKRGFELMCEENLSK